MTSSTPEKAKAEQPEKLAVKQRQCIVIIGMHRSGTSALAGLLSILGCDQPRTQMPTTKDNEKGYFESQEIYGFHTSLLDSAGSRWDDWLRLNSSWFKSLRAEEFHDRAKTLLQEEYGESRLFVLKDPRICRLTSFWDRVLVDMNIEPRYLLTCRNPLEVAASLEARDRLNHNIGLLIWLRHVLDAEIDTRQKMRSFTNFSQVIENWGWVAEKVQTDLKVNLPRMAIGLAPEVEMFLSSDLRHHTQTTEKVVHDPMISAWIRDTYEIFNRWSLDGENPKDHARLDEIREVFDAAGPLFARVVMAGRDSEALVHETKQRLEKLNSEHVTVQSEATALLGKFETARKEVEVQTDVAAKLEAEHKALEDKYFQTQSALEQRSHEAEETHAALEALRAEHADRASAHEAERKALEDKYSQTQSALEQRSLEAAEAHAALEALRAEHADRANAHEAERKALNSALVNEKSERAQIENKYSQKINEMDNREALLNTQVATLESRLETQHQELAKLPFLLSQKEATLASDHAAAKQALARETSQRKGLETQLAEAEQKVALERTKSTQAGVLHAQEVSDFNSKIKKQSEEMAKITNFLSTKERALQTVTVQSEAALEAERKRAERAEFAVIEIQSSTSWRMMKPLRALSSIFRRNE